MSGGIAPGTAIAEVQGHQLAPLPVGSPVPPRFTTLFAPKHTRQTAFGMYATLFDSKYPAFGSVDVKRRRRSGVVGTTPKMDASSAGAGMMSHFAAKRVIQG
jgi:hypothetical protein